MSQLEKKDEMAEHVKDALRVADRLTTAVLRGEPGQQRLALDYARALAAAKRAGYDLTENA